jgi:hypothetical protein
MPGVLLPPFALLGGTQGAVVGVTVAPTFDPSVYGLDALADRFGIYCPASRVLTSYGEAARLIRLRRGTDNDEADFHAVAVTGVLDTTSVSSWLGGATGYVVKVYDQSGNGHDIGQSSQSLQPTINLGSSMPFIRFPNAVSGARLVGTTGLDFARNQPHASIFTVCRYTNTGQTSCAMSVQTGGNVTRMSLQKTTTVFRAQARRLDADGATNTGGHAGNTNWVAQIGGWDFAGGVIHQRADGASETAAMGGAPGNSEDTDSSPESTFGAQYFNNFRDADFVLWGQTRDLLDTMSAGALATALAALKPA